MLFRRIPRQLLLSPGAAHPTTCKTILVLAVGIATGCGGDTLDRRQPEDSGIAGTYVVRADSSRVHFLAPVAAETVAGTFPRVLGALNFRQESRGFVRAVGTLQLDLASATLPDSARTRALREALQPGGTRDSAVELRVRDLFGKRFTSDLPVGGVTPISVRGQLLVRDRVLSRMFEGEITRTPSGYRLTNARPILMELTELGLGGVQAEVGRSRAGFGGAGASVAISVDLRLERRSEPAGG